MAPTINGPESPLYAMNAGDGPNSYIKNSSYQKGILDVAMPIIGEEIAKKLDIKHLDSTSSNAFCTADFGCSTGQNSFPAMAIIIQAVKQKYDSSGLVQIPEFYIFFNDVITNDFNTLFSSLPPNRNYNVAALPGDFHNRLLRKSSLHFAYSSWSLHWLTEVPKPVVDSDSPAWNKGQILYTQDRKEVCDAYLDQFGKDIESFLECRDVEMVGGGLMALPVPGVPAYWDPETECVITSFKEPLKSALMDMAKKGRFSEDKIDSFNIPYYFPTPQQLKAILERSHNFSIERLQILNHGRPEVLSADARAATMRAVHERLLIDHFGSEIIEELFDLYTKKLADSPVLLNPEKDKSIVVLAVLKRKID